MGPWPPRRQGERRQEGHARRREIRRLFRQGRAAYEDALAPHSRDVSRREGGRARSEFRAGRSGAGARERPEPLREPHRAQIQHRRPGPPCRQVAERHRALGLADAHPGASLGGSPHEALASGGRGGGEGVREQSARSPARRARRDAGHDGPRSRFSHRREGRGGGCHGQGCRHDGDLSARAEAGVDRVARHSWPPLQGTQGGADRHRQRHRLARDRQARERTGGDCAGAEAHENHGVGSGCVRLFRERLRQRRTSGPRRFAARRGFHRPPTCKTRSPSL